jgi:rod shape-determining protein MreB
MNIFNKPTMAVDPGSQTLRIARERAIVFDEPSTISLHESKLTGIGTSIVSDHIILKPVDYVIADFQAFEMLLRDAIKKTEEKSKRLLPPAYKMFFAIPTSVTEVGKRAYRDSAEHAGAFEVHMTFSSAFAAMGMNILSTVRDFILVDAGASKTDITIFANGLIIADSMIPFGSWKIKRLIKNHLFRKHNLNPVDGVLENIVRQLDLRGTGKINVESQLIEMKELTDVVSPILTLIQDEVRETIERVSHHPSINKAIANGMYFTGGASKIKGLKECISLDGQISFKSSDNPFHDVIKGVEKASLDPKAYKDYLMV